MKRAFAITAIGLTLGAMLAFIAPTAMAHDRVNWSLNVGVPFGVPVYGPPATVYVEPQPVYLRPRPVYVRPQPVYIEQEPVYGNVYVNGYRRPYYDERYWERRHHRHHGHHDWH
jgi:hypothetical protein